MSTNDHTVPQMYLKRFAETRRGRGNFLAAIPLSDLSKAFVTNIKNIAAVNGFYWGETPEGVAHHDMEKLLWKIENESTKTFSMMLDDCSFALPRRWPLGEKDRASLAWWIAAQILRTKRQRKRLAHIEPAGEVPTPKSITSFAANNTHLRFMAEQLAALASIIYYRPWGLGFSDACLLTSDVPVVILNGQDAENQLLAAAYWDIILPLDSHRLLILPHQATQADQRKRFDHLLKLDGAVGLFVTQVIYDAADTHVFHHPDHNPLEFITPKGPRLPTPWADGCAPDEKYAGLNPQGPEYVLDYEVLRPGSTVDRRWVSEHLPRK
ncbi:DUF4238 domain-containing protein [Nonomuraea sp. NPDC049655]|uniref:DUF4238 domain-containing protein n=1 Tax=Nonomuraea sp. NPDC049655 TaxID=3364355 RepID=UPI00379B7629